MQNGSRTTSRRDFKPKGLQAEIKTLQAHQNTILSSVKRYFSNFLASLVHNKLYSRQCTTCDWHPLITSAGF